MGKIVVMLILLGILVVSVYAVLILIVIYGFFANLAGPKQYKL